VEKPCGQLRGQLVYLRSWAVEAILQTEALAMAMLRVYNHPQFFLSLATKVVHLLCQVSEDARGPENS
jgi:hypothetical protein